MAQSGYTPILLYGSSTAAAVPGAANLTSSSNGAELALNYADGRLYYKDAAGTPAVQIVGARLGANVTTGGTIAAGFGSATGVTGTGNFVFSTSPALTTPNLGTPSAVTLTNATGLPLTTGVTGVLPIANGGTNSTATATAGGIGYGTGTAHAYTAAGTAGYLLQSNGSSAPTWVAAPTGSAATPTTLGTVYGSMTTSGASPYLTALGYNAAPSTTGVSNTAVGASALYANTTGTKSVAVGYQALTTTSYTTSDVAIGYRALYLANYTVSGYNGGNVAIGDSALYSAGSVAGNSTGGCVAVGNGAGYSLSSAGNGAQNTYVGSTSGYYNVSGGSNTYIGWNSAGGATNGDSNVVVGSNAGRQASGTWGSKVTAIGYGAVGGTSGNDVTVVGAASCYNAGTSVVYVGTYAGLNNTGSYNAIIGAEASYASSSASYNAALGFRALYSNTTGANNVAVGGISLALNTTGAYNTAVGYNALYTNNTASNNTAVGYQSLFLNTTGANNTAVGYQSLTSNTTGTNNTAVGHSAGSSTTTGTNNTFLGRSAVASTATSDNEIVLGYNVTGQGDGYVTIGRGGLGKIYNAYYVNATWTQTSDGTMKNIVGPDTLGLSFINRLNPIKFTWKPQNELPTDHPYYAETNAKDTTTVIHGFVAQEVKAALDAEGCTTFNGWDQGPDGIQAISREMFISPLVKAVQELSAQVEALKAEIATLKGA